LDEVLVCEILLALSLLFCDSTHPSTLFSLPNPKKKEAFPHFENPKSNTSIWVVIYVK
jgi:hypothetical protein